MNNYFNRFFIQGCIKSMQASRCKIWPTTKNGAAAAIKFNLTMFGHKMERGKSAFHYQQRSIF